MIGSSPPVEKPLFLPVFHLSFLLGLSHKSRHSIMNGKNETIFFISFFFNHFRVPSLLLSQNTKRPNNTHVLLLFPTIRYAPLCKLRRSLCFSSASPRSAHSSARRPALSSEWASSASKSRTATRSASFPKSSASVAVFALRSAPTRPSPSSTSPRHASSPLSLDLSD